MATDHERMQGWIDGFSADVEAMKGALTAKGPREAKAFVAGALSYLVTRMDLIPDWEETCGILDDAMVLRVAAALATEKGLDAPHEVARLANDADGVAEFLGKDLAPRFKKYVEGLATTVVRGRHPDMIVDDEKARGHLFADVADDLKRLPAAPMSDPDAVARTIKNYFSQKLGAK